MACEFVCDGCGKRVPATRNYLGDPVKPPSWYAKRDADGTVYEVCSRECIDRVVRRTGTSGAVLPL